METKQATVLPTFNDQNRYGEQIITQGQFPEGGMSSGGGGTEIQSFDFPEPDTNPSNKALDPLDQVKAERKAKRRGKRAVNKANRFNKRNPNTPINVPVGKGTQALQDQINKPLADYSLPPIDVKQAISDMTGKTKSPFGMVNQQYDQQSPQGTVPMQNLMPDQTAMSYQPPMPGNTQGTAKPLFNQGTANAAQQIYGSEEQRQQSVPGAPLYMHHGTSQFAAMLGFGGEVASTKNITKKVLKKDKTNSLASLATAAGEVFLTRGISKKSIDKLKNSFKK